MKYKILHYVPGFDHGGIESRLLDWYNNIDRDKFQFDLLILTSVKDNVFIKEFESLGGKVYILPKFNLKNYIKFKLELNNFFKNNSDYDAVHCHSPITGKYVLELAKNYKIPTRILHSRTVKIDSNRYQFFKKYLVRKSVQFATTYFACSKEAGDWIYGENDDFQIINNGITTDQFVFNYKTRDRIRKELNLSNFTVIGNVSRFTPSKKHDFLIEILYELDKRNGNFCLLLIGDGPTKSIIEKIAEDKGVIDKVLFLGKKHNVSDYYQAMDIFVFPSEYEGFGTVAVESQASGLKTIVSTGVPNSVDVTNLVTHLPLENGVEYWADIIMKNKNYLRENKKQEIINKDFDVMTTVKKLETIYSKK